MFSRIRMVNGWFTGSVVSNLELEAIDAMRPKAIDGDGGGTYAPTATLTIGGLATTLSATTLFEMVERIERWESTSASSAAL